jgi:hypothetical protein
MHQQKKDEPSRDPYAALSGGDPPDDYPDWNNPEDAEDAPEGYYADDDETEDDDDSYIPGPDDPDYDLSEEAGYAGWEAPESRDLLPQWVIATVSIILILAIAIPAIFLLR